MIQIGKASEKLEHYLKNLNLILLLLLLQLEGHYHEEVNSVAALNLKQKYYQGYPGQPEIDSSHFIEQSPGYGHPYLPGVDTDIDIDHFLWTGDISSDETTQDISSEEPIEVGDGFSVTQKIYPDIPVISPSSVFVTRDGIVYTTLIQPTPVFVPFGTSTSILHSGGEGSGSIPAVYPTHDPPSSHSQPHPPYYESDRTHGNGYQYTNGYYDMPEPQFLIRTVLKNDTDLLKRSVDLQAFKVEMEDRLTRTYRQAYKHLELAPIRNRRAADFTTVNKTQIYHGRVIRATPVKDNVKVRIHNIRSARPEPEIEILYAVYEEEEEEPILATEAVKVINDNVEQDEITLLLGHPLKIQAEPYLQQSKLKNGYKTSMLGVSLALSIIIALLLCLIIYIIYRQFLKGKKKHDILISSAGTSKHASPSAPRKELCDDGAFTLERGLRKHPNINVGRDRLQSDKSDVSDGKHDRTKGESGGETPSLADHSSNNTPAGIRKSKTKALKRRDRRAQRRSGNGLTTSDESEPDSAFPARTPENIKALDDLLEEEVPVPGDSGRGSIYPGHPGWAFLDTPGHEREEDWQATAEQVQKNAALYRETLDETLPVESAKRKAKSAKSHIFRKDKVAAELTEEVERVPARPWSATEPRWNADRMFTTKQKNWEGLAAGRKHLHHGQLLPGSTESTDEDNVPRKTCWSEGASPGRPPPPASMIPDPATPLIQAIRSELRRFQRSQNSGVTIVTDPDLLDRESKA